MTPGIRPLVAGNWKMNGTSAAHGELLAIAEGFSARTSGNADGLICVPATLLQHASEVLSGSAVTSGGQDCHWNESGAHTGDISAEMLRACGASHVIVGHSERRTDHRETDAIVADKARAAWRAGLVAIICVGETRAEREAGQTLDVLSTQLRGSVPHNANSENATPDNTVIAYEPVWAIGTGLTPTVADIAEAHAHIRATLESLIGEQASSMRILYGGSMKPSNAAELLAIPNVDGGLIGGASLKADDFLAIADALA